MQEKEEYNWRYNSDCNSPRKKSLSIGSKDLKVTYLQNH